MKRKFPKFFGHWKPFCWTDDSGKRRVSGCALLIDHNVVVGQKPNQIGKSYKKFSHIRTFDWKVNQLKTSDRKFCHIENLVRPEHQIENFVRLEHPIRHLVRSELPIGNLIIPELARRDVCSGTCKS